MKLLFSIFLFAPFAAQALVSEPAGCWAKKKFPCAIRTAEEPASLKLLDSHVRLAAKSSLLITKYSLVRLLSGQVLVEQSPMMQVQAFTVEAGGAGKYFLEMKKQNEVHLVVIKDLVSVSSRTGESIEQVPEGFENWYSGLAVDAKLLHGVMRPLDAKQVVLNMSKELGLSRAEMKELALGLVAVAQSAVEASGELYQQVAIQRKIASEDRESEQARIRQQKQAELERMRQMFRSRFYDGP